MLKVKGCCHKGVNYSKVLCLLVNHLATFWDIPVDFAMAAQGFILLHSFTRVSYYCWSLMKFNN